MGMLLGYCFTLINKDSRLQTIINTKKYSIKTFGFNLQCVPILVINAKYFVHITSHWNDSPISIDQQKLFLSERNTGRRFVLVTFLEEQKSGQVEISRSLEHGSVHIKYYCDYI